LILNDFGEKHFAPEKTFRQISDMKTSQPLHHQWNVSIRLPVLFGKKSDFRYSARNFTSGWKDGCWSKTWSKS